MLQWEFEERIGRKVDVHEYIDANRIYEQCSFDKDKFCKIWKKSRGNNELYQDLVNQIEKMRRLMCNMLG